MGYIYGLKNKLNNKYYIGQTKRTPEIRLDEHIKEKNRDRAKDRKLYIAINEFGIHNFELITIEECNDLSLNEKEKYYIELYDSKYNGYNETFGGKGKPFVDEIIEMEIINIYTNNKISIKEMSDKFGLCTDTIRYVLKRNGIEIKRYYNVIDFKIKMIDVKNNIKIFNNFDMCIGWLMNNNELKISTQRIKEGILRVINGKRNSYLKYNFIKIIN